MVVATFILDYSIAIMLAWIVYILYKIRSEILAKDAGDAAGQVNYTPETLMEELNGDFNSTINPDEMNENFEFVLRCIRSCMNSWQLKTANLMVERFGERYGNQTEFVDLLLGALVEQQSKLCFS